MLRIDDSFGKHRRLFFIAPTNTWASQSTSFPKGVFSLFQRTLFLFINWYCRQLTKITDTSHKILLIFVWQNGHAKDTKPKFFCRAVPGYVLALLKSGNQWDVVSPLTGTLQERKGSDSGINPTCAPLKIYWFVLSVVIDTLEKFKWLSRKSVGIKLEVEGKTSFVLWQKNISKQ